MKIRIKGNALRYRLTKSDIVKLDTDGHLSEQSDFVNTVLTYAIKTTEKGLLWADFSDNTITLFMPVTLVRELADTDKIGFSGESGKLHLLVEKDFTCLDNVEEDQSDNYPNPLLLKKD